MCKGAQPAVFSCVITPLNTESSLHGSMVCKPVAPHAQSLSWQQPFASPVMYSHAMPPRPHGNSCFCCRAGTCATSSSSSRLMLMSWLMVEARRHLLCLCVAPCLCWQSSPWWLLSTQSKQAWLAPKFIHKSPVNSLASLHHC